MTTEHLGREHRPKTALRSEYRRLRDALMPMLNDALVNNVLAFLRENSETTRMGAIGITWPLPGEPDLRCLADRQPAPLALPATAADYSITYHCWRKAPSLAELHRDAFSIPAPLASPALQPMELALLLIPALAIDPNGVRLGYGGGCYDRLLRQTGWSDLKTLAVLPEACVCSSPLPADPWDRALDGWITENGWKRRWTGQRSESSAR